MEHNDHLLARIEWAERETPRCSGCGDHTVIAAHPDNSVWLECRAIRERRARPGRLRRWGFPSTHTRHRVISGVEAAA